ncbi:DNA polymerase III subunit delta' [Lacticaseibacillus camelliae]|uniref:DNA replication ATPase n=1 Tax=Lacticaseibacillus camelliae DSM 22697 = JCM 13995 TaxID=1423730 RepID=A0A0R2F3B8_9LACO|nr:DNA polymerase III subunit delta' [Lacticaseibacillus camelliae]KRN23007.1 DNA replication ATPase [Lacticaseibacillus camelliae DSM 22697 = JCM 13995]
MNTIETLQPVLVRQFSQIIGAGNLSSAYIFAGADGTGKAALAQWIAMRLFCQNVQAGKPCGKCPECQRVLSGNHPDVVWLNTDAKSIKVDDVRAMRQEMSKTGVEGNRRVFVIEDAEKLTAGAENSLLKYYEEPVPGMTIILTTAAKNQLLPTIRSRAQVISFPQPPAARVKEALVAAGADARLATVAANLTADTDSAQVLVADEQFEKRVTAVLQLVTQLSKHDATAFVAVQTTLLPLAKTLQEQTQTLALLGLAYADALNQHYHVQAPRTFGNDLAILALAEQTGARLSAGLSAVLTAEIRLGQNVSFQSAVEALVLQLLEG